MCLLLRFHFMGFYKQYYLSLGLQTRLPGLVQASLLYSVKEFPMALNVRCTMIKGAFSGSFIWYVWLREEAIAIARVWVQKMISKKSQKDLFAAIVEWLFYSMAFILKMDTHKTQQKKRKRNGRVTCVEKKWWKKRHTLDTRLTKNRK